MTLIDIATLKDAFQAWKQGVSSQPEAERHYEERFLEIKSDLESMGFGVEIHQDYLTGTQLLQDQLWRRTECMVFRGALEFKASELTHSAQAKVSALHAVFMRVLAWQFSDELSEGESGEIPRGLSA